MAATVKYKLSTPKNSDDIGFHSSDEDIGPFLGIYGGWETTQLCGDYNQPLYIYMYIRIPIQQPGFPMESIRVFVELK